MDLKEIVWCSVDWIHQTHDKDQWRAFVNSVMNLLGSIIFWETLWVAERLEAYQGLSSVELVEFFTMDGTVESLLLLNPFHNVMVKLSLRRERLTRTLPVPNTANSLDFRLGVKPAISRTIGGGQVMSSEGIWESMRSVTDGIRQLTAWLWEAGCCREIQWFTERIFGIWGLRF
jgi:hypothetical protein